LSVGFIGLGGWPQRVHAPAVKSIENLRIVACSDIDEQKVRLFREKFGCERGYTDYREMLEKEALDIVLVATPHLIHAKVAIDALESGAHVYLEKPMATSLEEALRLASIARSRSRILVVGHVLRLDSLILTASKLVKSGRLGKVYYGRSLILRRKGIPSTPTFLKKSLAGGGALLDIGSHAIDNLLFITGFPIPKSASGAVYRVFSRRYEMLSSYPLPTPPKPEEVGEIEVEDFAVGMIRFSENLTAYIEVSWASYLRDDAYEVTVLGDHGGLVLDGRNNRLNYMFTAEGEFMVSEAPFAQSGGDALVRTQKAWSLLAGAVAEGRSKAPYPLCTAEQGVLITAVLEAIYRSSETGKEVDINLPSWVLENLGW